MNRKSLLLASFALLTGCQENSSALPTEKNNETISDFVHTDVVTEDKNTEDKGTSDITMDYMELFTDTKFETGLYLKSTTTADGSKVVKHLDYDGKAKPKESAVWNMAQWWTPFNFKDAPYRFENGRHVYENESRILGVDAATGEFEMGLDSWKEYQERFSGSRTSGSQTWSHFLIEQNFADSVYLSSAESMTLSFDFRIDEVTLFDKENYNPNLHTAQFVMYFTVRNDKLNKFFWFGIPLYDYRGYGDKFSYSIDKGFEGATNTLIYSIGRNEILPDGLPAFKKDYHIEIDLLNYIKDAIVFGATNSSIGKPLKEWNLDDCYVNYMNFGWELPGSFKIDSRFKNLSLKVE